MRCAESALLKVSFGIEGQRGWNLFNFLKMISIIASALRIKKANRHAAS